MYIDGVFSGGGIKGLALIGAYQAIEKKGLQFKRVAGTSAGAIIAALVAAQYTSEEIKNLIDEINFEDFMDARSTIVSIPLAKWLFLYWKMGLYKGVALENWIHAKLAARGIVTFRDLPPHTLRIIASDLTDGRLMVLPDDLVKYGYDPQIFPIARAIRMSCSLPYFFEPVKLKTYHHTNIIVDGGVLSNFPMWLFDKENVKKVRPVIGIKLSHSEHEMPKNKITNAIQLFEGLFDTMKDAHDSRYISRKHEKNIIFIPTDGISTTEFKLSEKQKIELYELGEQRAEGFLSRWSY